MRLKSESNKLAAALRVVGSTVEKRSGLMVCSSALLEADNGQLRLTGTNMEMEVSTTVPADVAEPGSVAVNAVKLTKIVSAANGEISFNLAKTLTVKTDRGRFSLAIRPADEFPYIEDHDAKTPAEDKQPPIIRMSAAELNRIMAATSASMARQDVRYYLNGLYLEIVDKNTLIAVTTDGHRLSSTVSTIPELPQKPSHDLILPRDSIKTMRSLIAEGADEIVMQLLTGTMVKFQVGNITAISKLIDGKYPDWRRAVPEGDFCVVRLNRAALSDVLKIVIGLGRKNDAGGIGMAVTVDKGKLTLMYRDAEEDGELSIDADYQGEPFEQGFNSIYLLDAVSAIGSDEVIMNFLPPGGQLTMHAPDDPDNFFVVSPMRL